MLIAANLVFYMIFIFIYFLTQLNWIVVRFVVVQLQAISVLDQKIILVAIRQSYRNQRVEHHSLML